MSFFGREMKVTEHGSYSRAVRRRQLRVLFCTVACLAALGMLPSVSYQLVFSRGLRGFLYEYAFDCLEYCI
jgi:hypothetical protein